MHAVRLFLSCLLSGNSLLLYAYVASLLLQRGAQRHGHPSHAASTPVQQPEHEQHSVGFCIAEPPPWFHAAQGAAEGAGAQAASLYLPGH